MVTDIQTYVRTLGNLIAPDV